MKVNKSLLRGGIAVFSSLFVALLVAKPITNTWRAQIDTALGTSSYETIAGDRYSSKYKTTDELVEEHKKLGELAGEESVVLLKNDSALPLANSATDKPKVTLFGIGSEYTKFGGDMGSQSNETTPIAKAFEERGIEVNPVMKEVYNNLGSIVTGVTKPQMPWEKPSKLYGHRIQKFGGALKPYTVSEPMTELYTKPAPTTEEDVNGGGGATKESLKKSFEEYNDAAIVVLTRPGTEGSDYYEGEQGNTDKTRDILAISKGEEDVISMAKENFDNVIVLINSCNPLEIESLKNDPKIKGIMWIGFLGDYGTYGLANVIKGFNQKGEAVSPSAGLVDTYAVDNSNNPAVVNNVGYKAINAEDIKIPNSPMGDLPATTPPSTFSPQASLASDTYMIEAEGIYTGYKYYETRYYDTVVNKSSNASSNIGASNDAANWKYQDEVSYTFGEGYSYTTFEKTITNIKAEEDALKVAVKVTNTGNISAKTPVQVYVQTPYTEYDKNNNVEKAAIQLAGFTKTEVLSPNETKIYEIELPKKYFASWNSNAKKGEGGYILDKGDYYFAVGDGAHDAINAMLALQGKTVNDGMDAEGNKEQAKKYKYDVQGEADEKSLAYSKTTGAEIKNQLSDIDWNYYKNDTVKYLSRNNYKDTFPKEYDDLSYIAQSKELMDERTKKLTNEVYEFNTDASIDIKQPESNTKYTIAEMAAVENVFDPRWDELVKQIPAETLYTRLLRGGSVSDIIEEVESPFGYQNDGPNGFQSTLGSRGDAGNVSADDKNKDFKMNSMVGMNNLGATFNKELAQRYGELVGNDGLRSGNWSIWGVGSNTHRQPYNGRNFEYYSEDGILNGYIGKGVVEGSAKYGVINAPKHFAFNDQETYRGGIAPYMTEQKARENDLRAFQIPIEDGNSLGLMTSFNRVGATQVNGHTGLMTEILRHEWGFKGLISTDMASNKGLYRAELCILGGASMVADFGQGETFKDVTKDWPYMTEERISKDGELLKLARRNMKYQFYAFANSAASNVKTRKITPAWEIAFISTDVVCGVIALGLISFSIYTYIKSNKNEEAK